MGRRDALDAAAPSFMAVLAVIGIGIASPAAAQDDVRIRLFGVTGFYEIDWREGPRIGTVNSAGRAATWFGGCFSPDRTHRTEAQDEAGFFPLAVGKTMVLRVFSDQGQSWRVDFQVEAEETVNVPAGAFTAFRIVAQEVGETHTFERVTKCWFAPQVGFFVKTDQEVRTGTQQTLPFFAMRIDRRSPFVFTPPVTGRRASYSTNTSQHVCVVNGTTVLDARAPPSGWFGGAYWARPGGRFAADLTEGYARLWPLIAGQPVRFQATPAQGNAPGRVDFYEVEYRGSEVVATPAGSFYAHRLVTSVRAGGSNLVSAMVSYESWWSPALGLPVRYAWNESAFQRGSSGSMELTGIAAAPC